MTGDREHRVEMVYRARIGALRWTSRSELKAPNKISCGVACLAIKRHLEDVCNLIGSEKLRLSSKVSSSQAVGPLDNKPLSAR